MDPPPPSWPTPRRDERIADGVMHGAGLAFAVAGAVLLTLSAAIHAGGGVAVAVGVYGAALIGTFLASALYHMTPWHRARPTLRRLDHAAIYLKIAGTYTPLVALMGTGFAYAVLGVVWALALGGAALKLVLWREPGALGVALYLLLGWLSVLLLWPLATTLPVPATILVGIGGLLYTTGVAVYASRSLRFQAAIWHGFVLAASGCFFAAIAVGTLSGP